MLTREVAAERIKRGEVVPPAILDQLRTESRDPRCRKGLLRPGDHRREGEGLRIMAHRARMIDATLEISFEEDLVTVVHLAVPLGRHATNQLIGDFDPCIRFPNGSKRRPPPNA